MRFVTVVALDGGMDAGLASGRAIRSSAGVLVGGVFL